MLYNKNWDPKSPRSILNRAADLIEKHGHLKHYLGDVHVGMCVNGAILEAVGINQNEDFYRIRDIFANYLGGPIPVPGNAPVWNNAPERTKEDVVAKLREAANAV